MNTKDFVKVYGIKSATNDSLIDSIFAKDVPHPETLIDIRTVSSSELSALPKTLTCKVHGEFNLQTTKMFTKSSYLVHGVCSKCVDARDRELELFRDDLLIEVSKERFTAKLADSGLSKRHFDKSFDNYTADTEGKQKALAKCKKLCDQLKNNEQVNNLIMVGGVGTGKTHLASSILRDLVTNGKRVALWTLIDVIRALKATWKKDAVSSEDEMIDYFTKIELLIIDEVGVQFGSDTEKMFIFDIINGRYENMLPTVIISNLDISGVKDLIGERCIDRLREDGGQVVAFDWKSHR